jgi:N-acylglucosamine 2-epimerase
LYACLLALHLTGEPKYADWYEKVFEWAYAHFPDPEYGEWFKYLHRDGTVSHTLKGSRWDTCFHLGRMQLYSWRLLEEMLGSSKSKQ